MNFITFHLKKAVIAAVVLAAVLTTAVFVLKKPAPNPVPEKSETPIAKNSTAKNQKNTADENKDYIKWVDFNVTCKAMTAAMNADISSAETDRPIDWIQLLAYLGAKYGGNFSSYKQSDLNLYVNRIKDGEEHSEIVKDMKYYDYYYKAYSAVLSQYVGQYYKKIDGVWKPCYGMRAFSPIAEGYSYSDYDDFGSSRSYGYARKHLGHDMMGSIGTPVIAVEGGYVEAIGWNQYGGWRIGIRSFDKKRYYYYAHLRKNRPYRRNLKEGDTVKAGDVIGYLGMTGYSSKENVNNINVPHLHFGIQLIFDESQKDGNGEIWIDCYELTKFLSHSRSTVEKSEDGEFHRVYDIEIPEE